MQLSKKPFYKSWILLSLLLPLLSTTLLISQVDAYHLNGSRVDRPNQIKYWFDNSISQIGYTSAATHGSTAWNGVPGVNLKINATATSSASSADVKWYAASANNDLGQFYAHYEWSGGLASRSVISINTARFKNIDSDQQKETTAHEMGHALGLDHEDDVPAIMVSSGWENSIYPVQDDKDGIHHIYID